MNLTGQQPYLKHSKKPKRPKLDDRSRWDEIRALGCIISNSDCGGKLELHHPTGAGMGLKSSDKDVIPLCFNHHSAQTNLSYGHSVHKGTKVFESIYGTQKELLEKTKGRR